MVELVELLQDDLVRRLGRHGKLLDGDLLTIRLLSEIDDTESALAEVRQRGNVRDHRQLGEHEVRSAPLELDKLAGRLAHDTLLSWGRDNTIANVSNNIEKREARTLIVQENQILVREEVRFFGGLRAKAAENPALN